VPQSISYSLVAGLPAVYGLYTSVIPALVYPFLGSSKCLSVGPTAVLSLLTASAVSSMNPLDTNEYISYAIMLAIIVGMLQLVMGVLRLGFLINFLSKPVLSGFSSACAIIIAVGQLKNIFQVSIDDSAQQLHVLLGSLGKAIFTPTFKGSDNGVYWPSFGMGIGCIILILVLQYSYVPIKGKKWKLSTFVPVSV
jgi:SulP family sulfate permease